MSDAVRKYDLYGPDFKRDPYPTFAAMRRDDPILQQPGLDGKTPIWFVTRYGDVEAMLRDLVSQGFTPKRVADLRPRIEAIADTLLRPLVARGEADLIDAFAFPLPTIVILEMLGVPADDHGRFRAWANALLEPAMTAEAWAEATRLLTEFTDYLRELFAERRARPRDDLLSALIAAEQAGDRLSENELFSTMVLLIVAGHETTVNLIANAVLALSERPDLRDALAADPSGLPRAIEEFLRYDGSVERALNRWAAEDVEWDGQLIRRGDPVILILSSANRDPERFERPDALELGRSPNPHLGFGKGLHYCLGSPLARLETDVALTTLLARLPNLRLAVPEEELRYRFLPGFRGLEALPVRWDVR